MNDKTDDLYSIEGRDAKATGLFSERGLTVQAGSIARKELVTSIGQSTVEMREHLTAENILEEHADQLRFTQDCLFTSPSAAAAIVLGRNSNGWVDWKHSDGRSLSDVKRVRRASGHRMLTESIRNKIINRCEQLISEGRIYTKSQLNQYYSIFSERFGSEKLKSLDGEALLTFMHDLSNRDSLVYWLEYKNDEEFNTKRFGSISGGSALKYRIFRRKETGHWQAGNKKNRNRPEDISIEEAIEYARDHRDQLLRGLELLENLPDDATDDDYALLQDQMDELAPDVSRLSWGHKYFSLLFPAKLDDYHIPELHRFHLRKMLQLPPEGEGRYISAGRFMSASDEAGLLVNQLASTLNVVHGRQHRYWRVGTRDSANQVSHWKLMQERDTIAIGWSKLGDLSWVESKRDSKEKLRALIDSNYADKTPSSVGRDVSQISKFIDAIKEGDIIIAADGATILGLGRVIGQYQFEPNLEFPHERPVEWLNTNEWRMPVDEGLRSTVREIKLHDENIIEVERHIRNVSMPQFRVQETSAPFVKRTIRLDGYSGRIQSVLDRKGQVILYGPPGTGKTYWAEKAVSDLASISAFGKRFDDLREQEKNEVLGDGASLGMVRFCCFHPAYGYEDFLEGYRPHVINNQMAFELRDGVFKKLCEDAVKSPERNFYLLVDEINRGDIPRIFGELLTTLEKNKRGKRIVLPVSQNSFSVPRNVYMVGTMNTADRSISLLDAALRRRFGFIEMMPDGAVLKNTNVSGIPLSAWFNALNERIREHVGRDARNLQIGHSYFMQAASPIKDIAALKRVIRDDIIPLLEEYCYEDYSTLENILGKDLIDVKQERIRQELFVDGQEESLVQSLLAFYPEINSSSEALESDESSDEEDGEDDDDDVLVDEQ